MATPQFYESQAGSVALPARGVAGEQPAGRRRGNFISAPLFLENLRRLWPLSLLGLIVLLVSGPMLLILLGPQTSAVVRRQQWNNLENANIGFVLFQAILPAIVAVLTFRYLNSTAKASVVHALPVTRGELFRSNVIAGFVLVAVPQLLLALSLLPFVRLGMGGFLVAVPGPAGTGPDVGSLLRWLLVSFVILCFIYAASVLASVVTGNTGVAFVVVVLINSVAPGAYAIIRTLLSMFLYGFPHAVDSDSAVLHPAIYAYARGTHASGAVFAGYFAIAVLLVLVAHWLYTMFKSERAGDAVAFHGFEVAIALLVTFASTCILGMFLAGIRMSNVNDYSRFFFYLGGTVGAVVGFIVITMILRKTMYIFNRATLRRFGVFAVLCALLMAFTTVDVTGYEHRIPAAGSIRSASVQISMQPLLPYGDYTMDEHTKITDHGTIDKLLALHQAIVETHDSQPVSTPPTNSIWVGELDLDYRLEHPGILPSLTREYSLSGLSSSEKASLAGLLNSNEYRKATSIGGMTGYDSLDSFTVGGLYGDTLESTSANSKGDLTFPATDAQELARLLDEDYERLPQQQFDDLVMTANNSTGTETNANILVGITFDLRPGMRTTSDQSSNAQVGRGQMFYGITKQYTRSIAWLKSHGYYDRLATATRTMGLNSTGN